MKDLALIARIIIIITLRSPMIVLSQIRQQAEEAQEVEDRTAARQICEVERRSVAVSTTIHQ